jgi:hypothetical protein
MIDHIQSFAQHGSTNINRAGSQRLDHSFEQAINRLERAMNQRERIIIDNVEELVDDLAVAMGNLTESSLFEKKSQKQVGHVMRQARRRLGVSG